MRRVELAHVLRAAAMIAGDNEILVIGSQAILASHSEEELPEEAWLSEADAARQPAVPGGSPTGG